MAALIRPALGAHLSISGGLHKAFARARVLGCDALQIFTRNNMQWRASPINDEETRLFLRERARSGIEAVIAHANYLINLASPDSSIWNKSVESMVLEILRIRVLEINHIILHPGSHRGEGEGAGESQLARALDRVLERFHDWDGRILLETAAGQGRGIGATFESLRRIRDSTDHRDKIGFCLDTCHIFAGGYDTRTIRAYRKTMKQFDETVGLHLLFVVHMNDSKGALGSKIDRHAHIGKGQMGISAFRNFLRDQRLLQVPFIIETPKGVSSEGIDYDAENLETLRSLIEHSEQSSGRRTKCGPE